MSRAPLGSRGTVTLCFDDGYQAVYDRVLPLLRQFGIRAVFAVPTDTDSLAREEGAPITAFAAWRDACARDDHELAAHGVTHRALPSLSDAALRDELDRSRADANATTVVYPGGAHDDRVVSETKRRFRAARTVLRGLEILPPRDPFRLRAFVATRRNFRVWEWNLRAVWAWATNHWLIETFHGVSPPQRADLHSPHSTLPASHSTLHTVPLDALERHLRFLKRLPLRIATIREVMHAGRL